MPDCCTGLSTIERICGANAAGLKTDIFLICRNEVTAIPAASGHIISTDLTLEATKFFSKFVISKNDQSYKAEAEGDADSTTINHVLSFFIPKLDAVRSAIFNDIIGGEFIVVFTDKNGKQRLLGDLEEAASLKVTEQTNDKNGYLCTLELSNAQYAYFYTGTAPLS